MTSKTDITVGKLVDMIQSGELSLPEMQRGYVWRADRVRDLLDSLYRGYPSGTILVWETERSVPSRDLAISQKDNPFRGHKLLLDGQQRLTSLSSILRGEPVMVHGQKKPMDILFNLNHREDSTPDEPNDDALDEEDDDAELNDEEDTDDEDIRGSNQEQSPKLAFAKPSRALLADPYWVRVSDIFSEKADKEILKRALPGGWDDPNYATFSERLQKVRQIKNYIYVMQVLETSMQYEEVAEIFVRVNSRGAKLRSSDLALAQITSRWRDSLRLFEEFCDSCHQRGFFLDLGLVVRALVVFATGQSRFKTVSSLSRQQLESQWGETKTHMRWALDYLNSTLGIGHPVLLSSPFLIIALAYYHKHQLNLTAEQVKALRRWFFFANSRGHYSRGSTETFLDADLALIRAGKGPIELLEVLQRQVGRLEFTPNDLASSGMLSPILPTVFLALRHAGAIDLHTGLGLQLPDNIKARLNNWHYVFSQQSLDGFPAERSEKREIANMLFVGTTKGGPKSAGSVEKWLPRMLQDHGPEALHLHGLVTDPDMLKPAMYRQFLEYRRLALSKMLNDFINGEIRQAKSTLDVAALIAKGECETIEFKERAIDDKGQVIPYISREVVSFLNTDGGVLLVGVEDSGTIVGVDGDIGRLNKKNTDNYLKIVMDSLLARIGKVESSSVRLSLCPVQGQQILLIEVPKCGQSAYCKEGEKPRPVFYIRVGNQCQVLEGKEAEQYIQKRWNG